MLTRCSSCGTVFRVHAEELGAARGMVACGVCGTRFNALDALIDEPVAARSGPGAGTRAADARGAAPPAGGKRPAAGPAFVLVEPNHEPGAGRDGPARPLQSGDRTASGEALPIDLPGEPGIDFGTEERATGEPTRGDHVPAGPSLSADEHAVLFTDPGSGDTPALDPDDDADELDDVPLLLKDQMVALRSARDRRLSAALLWCLAGVLLAAILVLQIVWGHRVTVFEKVPGARSLAAAACARFGCDVNPAPEPDSIELRARDVRDHPQYRDALLVNATLVNRAGTARSYPVIQLGLYDHDGNVIGVRRFEPHEYLDHSIDIAAGMPAGRPVFIVLEVAAAGAWATSFEFKFL